jgi:hypothetical protein
MNRREGKPFCLEQAAVFCVMRKPMQRRRGLGVWLERR